MDTPTRADRGFHMYIDTDALSLRYRDRAVNLEQQRLLVTNFRGTQQEPDLTEPANCAGYGRVRHFRRSSGDGRWPSNPLPLDPAHRALGVASSDLLRAQVFQSAVCNWRCWYCFVPFNLLAANPKHSAWLSALELLDLYVSEPDPPPMIDLTGGQPDLVPEWVPWMMKELLARGLSDRVYLWSDDNLSNDFFWRFLSDADRELVATYPKYGRVCCFKGFDNESFSFNTMAEPALFERQFDLASRFVALGLDLYVYATFTTPTAQGIADAMPRFVDRLQAIDPHLPLRTVPLEIQVYSPVSRRLDATRVAAMDHQYRAIEAWQRELEKRFPSEVRAQNIVDIPLAS